MIEFEISYLFTFWFLKFVFESFENFVLLDRMNNLLILILFKVSKIL